MKNYKAIFIDIDGTLKTDSREISEKTVKVFSKLNSIGVLVIICSGRPIDYVTSISKECNASKYIIASNGGDAFDYVENKSIFCNKMSIDSCKRLYEISNSCDAKFMMHTTNISVIDFTKYITENKLSLDNPIEEFLSNDNVSQCVIYSKTLEPVKKANAEVEKLSGIKINNKTFSLIDESIPLVKNAFIDVTNIDTSKGLGIRKLLEYLKISSNETIGIGDGINDLPMFENVGYRIAMGNAFDEVKIVADMVTDDNNSDGVANALIKIFDLEV